jgi:hypothetical protein
VAGRGEQVDDLGSDEPAGSDDRQLQVVNAFLGAWITGSIAARLIIRNYVRR